MKRIGGNLQALLQVKDEGSKNAIGERVHIWDDVTALKGWLDLTTGDSHYSNFDAKIQESTHVFLCDFTSLKGLSKRWVWNPFSFLTGVIDTKYRSPWKWNPFSFISGNINNYDLDAPVVDVTSENARMVIQGLVYDILLIDNPMNMNEHLEIYLRFVGGQNG